MYINTQTLQRATESEIRAAHPNTSFATPFVAPEPYTVVFPAPTPTYDAITQTVRELAPVLTDKGHWEQAWEVVELFETQAEKDAAIAAHKKASVPQSVTMRQARLALLAAGKLADVDAAINAMPEPQRSAAKIEWEYSAAVDRNRELVKVLGPALGLSEDALDDLFIAAAGL